MEKRAVLKNYGLLGAMLAAMLTGGVTGWLWPAAAGTVRPLGQIFINLMFCVVVPLVFSSIAGAIAGMRSVRRAGRIMGVTVLTFVVTGILAAVLMFLLMKAFPPVLTPWQSLPTEAVGDYAAPGQLLVNFFTAEDFVGLLSRRAMLPLIVFSILFGFSVQMTGGKDSSIGKWLAGLSDVMMKFVQIITYYAPIAFFAIFADLVATYGSEVAKGYGRALLVYYPLCFIYIFTAFPLFAWFGGGKGAVGIMFKHIARPAVVSLGTCSSVATIPTNMEEAVETGVSKDIAGMVLPLGATMHMDGSCFSCVLKIAFVLGVFGEQLSWSRLHRSGGRPVLCWYERRSRRRLHRRVHHLLHLLPHADGTGLPHSGGYRQSGGPSRYHDQLRRRLCGQLHRLPLRGRQGLAPEAA